MIGATLGRYFMVRYLAITFWFFVGIFALVFIINFTEISRRFGDLADYSLAWGLGYALMQTPMIMQQAVPFIGLVSGMVTLISLNRKYELVVARAAGISAWQFLTPICLGAFLFGLLAVFVLNPIAAAGFATGQIEEAAIRAGGSTPESQGEAPWMKQRTDEGETFIGAASVLDDGRHLVGATFLTFDPDGAFRQRMDAGHAFLRDGFWELREVRRLNASGAPEALETARVPTNLSAEFVLERLASPETLSIYELPRKIAAARSFGLSADGFAMHFHALVALPALLVTMTLIAATVSMRFARMGQSATMIVGGVVAGFLLYVITVLVQAFGGAGYVPPAVAAWLPVIVAGFFGVTFLLYKEDG